MTPETKAALLAARETLVALYEHVLRQDAYIDELEDKVEMLQSVCDDISTLLAGINVSADGVR